MSDQIKLELEYIVKASNKMLYQSISTPSGLSEWFCDDVNIRKDVFTFFWGESEEEAKVVTKKMNEYIKFQWLEDEGTKKFFEFRIKIDEMTKEVALIVTDFCDESEEEETRLLWDNQINDLKHSIGG